MNTNERTISTRYTFFYKMVFAPFWICMFGMGTLGVWFGDMKDAHNAPPPIEIKYLFLALWIIGTAVITKSCIGLKRVTIRNGKIYISNFRREIAVSPSAIASVNENRWINAHPVTIRFRNVTAFGDRVTFIPTWRFTSWGRHPIVAELKQMAGIKA